MKKLYTVGSIQVLKKFIPKFQKCHFILVFFSQKTLKCDIAGQRVYGDKSPYILDSTWIINIIPFPPLGMCSECILYRYLVCNKSSGA